MRMVVITVIVVLAAAALWPVLVRVGKWTSHQYMQLFEEPKAKK